jgi:hypothetical protein
MSFAAAGGTLEVDADHQRPAASRSARAGRVISIEVMLFLGAGLRARHWCDSSGTAVALTLSIGFRVTYPCAFSIYGCRLIGEY